MSEADREKAINQEIAAIEKENNEGGKYTVSVKSFFQGNEFYYFVYQDYKDVRLVGTPPESLGKFGGDTDNWEWPRHTADFSMFRVYADANGNPADYSANNVPLKPKHYLPVNIKGVQENDYAMILGYPGRTNRWMPAGGIEQNVKFAYPAWVEGAKTGMDQMKKYMDQSDELRLKYDSKYASTANYWKNRQGMIDALTKFGTADALTKSVNLDIIIRTAGMAIAVTIGCAVIAFPLAYYMARYTRGATRGLFYVGVMLPMWASYIVKAYAWTMILSKGGIIYWVADHTYLRGLLDWLLTLPYIGGKTLSTSNLRRWLVFVYAWLPFMILPIHAAIERVPGKLLEASSDLGARPWQTFRHVLWPLAFHGVVAGSIFTFSLTLGDFIIPRLVGPPGLYIGTMVELQQGSLGNLPMAAAFTAVPIAIIAIYLWGARRLGAFDAL